MLHTHALSLVTLFQVAFPVTAMATATNKVGFWFQWALRLANRHFTFKSTLLIRDTATLLQPEGGGCSRRRLWAHLAPMNSKLMSTQHAATHSTKVAVGAAEPPKSQVMLNVNVQSTTMGKMFIT